jgi:hypothetical protein
MTATDVIISNKHNNQERRMSKQFKVSLKTKGQAQDAHVFEVGLAVLPVATIAYV